MKFGDFTQLADNYSQYRPGYSPVILDLLLGFTGKPANEIQFADVGAGTGIWTRMAAAKGCRVIAVEPNDEMRRNGKNDSRDYDFEWIEGAAETTGLPSDAYDIVTMASSFHWADYETAMAEFQRILKPNGIFCALWNTRHIESSPMLLEIERTLKEIVPTLKRVSSGRSEFCNNLFDTMRSTKHVENVVYLESRHTEIQSRERYLGLWNSVNDIRVQAGEEKFAEFMRYIEKRIANEPHIEAEYQTRAWAAIFK